MVVKEGIYTSPEGTTFACINQTECDFMWKKIHVEAEYGKNLETMQGGVVVDVGTNIGLFCNFAAECGLKVYGFEPIPVLAACARKNAPSAIITQVAIGDADNVDIVIDFLPNYTMLSGLGAVENGKMYDEAAKGTDKETAISDGFREAEKVHVKTQTLPTALRDAGQTGKIDLLKIDCEMMEDRVLAGMNAELWARVGRIAIEVHDVGDRIADCVKLLESHGFVVDRTEKAPPSFILGEEAKADTVTGLDACLVSGTRTIA